MDPAQRGVARVFQTYALYPHMIVAKNMGFGLKMTGHPKAEVKAKVKEASRILKLDDHLTHKPKALSGGGRHRVAIGTEVTLGLRRQNIEVDAAGSTHRVEITEALGGMSFLHIISVNAEKLVIEAKGDTVIAPGTMIGLRFDPKNLLAFGTSNELRLR
jgi:ABC-type sugar transport system ATPase subunit